MKTNPPLQKAGVGFLSRRSSGGSVKPSHIRQPAMGSVLEYSPRHCWRMGYVKMRPTFISIPWPGI
jgi:hypothetical protein